MPVVLTRPVAESQRWAARLREQGVATVVLPLLAIGPAPDPAALRAAAADLPRHAAVMFVSANAVAGFLAVAPASAIRRAWAPGPGTREALLAAGVPPGRIDAPADAAAQFDSESLWQQVAGQLHAGERLLLVRGGDAQGRSQGREWLASQLAAAGVQVDRLVAYTRQQPAWSDDERARALQAAGDGSCWLFSSSEALANLAALLPGQDWSAGRALATHARIAAAASALGFGTVRQCRPAFGDVLASIESAG